MAGPDLTGTRFEGAFDYANHTALHPLGLAAILLCVLAAAVSRRHVRA